MPAAEYSHGHHPSVVNAHAARTVANSAAYLVPQLVPGMRILDVGCGPGSITIDLARLLGRGGVVVGIDASVEVIETARAAAAAAGVENVEFRVGDAYDPTPGERWDVVHAHQVLQHLGEPVAALRAWREAGCAAILTGVETWCFESLEGRDFWGGQWAQRALHSAFAEGTERHGLADARERQEIADAWATWSRDDDGWMAMLHGWILARG